MQQISYFMQKPNAVVIAEKDNSRDPQAPVPVRDTATNT